jgi:hypothetical protein
LSRLREELLWCCGLIVTRVEDGTRYENDNERRQEKSLARSVG